MRVAAVGDIMMGDSSHFLGRGVAEQIRRHGPAYPLRNVRDLLASADLVIGNLESPLSAKSGESSWDRVYRGAAAVAPELRLGPCTVLNLANNHTYEHGRAMVAETRDILSAAGVVAVGGRGPASTDVDVVTVEAAGRRVDVMAASCIRDRLTGAADLEALTRALVGALRASRAELRIVTLHWGNEYVPVPAPTQVAAARCLVDAGAQLVIGHHPHVLQPVQAIGSAVVAYSLGNFVFDQSWTAQTRTGGILRVGLGGSGVTEWEFLPTTCGRDCAPRPAEGADAARAAATIVAALDITEEDYRRLLRSASRRHRIAMKWELLRNLPSVHMDTWHFLATKRKRPEPAVEPAET